MSPETLTTLKEVLSTFTYLFIQLSFLFLLISYLVGVLQEYIPPDKIKNILSAKKGKGYVIAALLGAITPFCSCSTIPFLKGLLRAEAGFGPMMTFLFSSPLLNPIVIGLFAATFGFKVTAIYFVMAMGVSIVSAFILDKLDFEKYILPFKQEVSCCGTEESTSCCGDAPKPVSKWRRIWEVTWLDFKAAFPYLLIGVGLGAIIHGFVPTEFITEYASADNPLAIPFAAVIGIPLYLRAVTVIPLAAAFVAKGMGIGVVMAFIIGSAGASLPEVILLKSMFRIQLIIAFLAVVLGMAVLAGLVFSVLF